MGMGVIRRTGRRRRYRTELSADTKTQPFRDIESITTLPGSEIEQAALQKKISVNGRAPLPEVVGGLRAVQRTPRRV